MTNPDYEDDDMSNSAKNVPIHTQADFEGMRKAGRLAAETLDYITPFVQVGVTTNEIDRLCHNFITERGAICAPLGYRGFPKSVCTSINEVVCHGIPSERALQEGDVVNIDVTTILDGWHGDCSRMYYAGKIKPMDKKLVDATYEAMMRGISVVKPGARLGDIGHAIQSYVEPMGFGVVRDFCGHGLGKIFHCAPSIAHYGRPHSGMVLEAGMFFTIEPMINASPNWGTTVLKDGWTATTVDKSKISGKLVKSAQFEHSLAVTETGYEIFTLSPAGLHKPPYA